MKAYKGFNKDMTCRGFQFEEGKTYETEKAELCESGFHACTDPLNVWDYYGPIDGNRFCEVDVDGISDEKSNDSKVAAKKIKIGAEIGISGLVKAHIEYVKETVKDSKDKSSGYGAKIGSSGDGAQIGSSGYGAKIGSSGDGAQIGSSGYGAQIGSSGDGAQIGSSGYGAQIGSSGYGAKIGSSGNGAKIECKAENAVVACAGKDSKVKGPVGTWFCLSEYGEYDGRGYPCICMKAARIDGETLKADTWYKLKNGEFVEVTE